MDGARRAGQRGVVACAGAVLLTATAAGAGLPQDGERSGQVPALVAASPSATFSQRDEAAWLAQYERRARATPDPTLSPDAATDTASAGEDPAVVEESPAGDKATTGDEASGSDTDSGIRQIAYRPGPSIHTEAVLALVVQYFPADQVGNAMAVARCESGHSNAVGATNRNGTTDWGVFQLNDGGTLQGALRRIGAPFSSIAEAQQLALDAETNVRAARNIYDSRGWAPWVCAYKTGIVASLYSNTPGPMAGQYDERGLVGDVDLTRTVSDEAAAIPTPTATPSPTQPQPSQRPTPTTTPTPSQPPVTAPPSTPPPSSATPTPSPPAASSTPSTSPAGSATPTQSPTGSAAPTATPQESATPSGSAEPSATPTTTAPASATASPDSSQTPTAQPTQ